jgi:hypothetical protein
MAANVEQRYYPPEVVAQRSVLYQQLEGMGLGRLFGNISLPTLVFSGLIIIILGAAVLDRR